MQAHTQTFEKGGADLRAFTKGGGESSENFDFEAKIRGVNSDLGEKLHDFEIICPGREVSFHPQHPPCVWACGHAHISTSLFNLQSTPLTSLTIL